VIHRLEIDSIHLQYGQRKILSDVYLLCQTGSVVGLLGRNGEGKSSLMNIAFGITKMEDYSVRIDRQNIKPAFQSHFGVNYLPQFNFIPSGMTLKTVFEFYHLSFENFTIDVIELKERANTKISELSGGLRRLVEIYLVIKKEALFVMLDEPFTHIMPVYIELICRWIKEEKTKKGFVISDHLYHSVLPICDYYYLLKQGKTHLVHERKDLVGLGYLSH
jgi:ABC-type multidrug transport system ATPase subunit